MSTTGKTWVLLDGITKIQSQPLQTEQLQLAILKLHERDWTRFYVWTQGWANWQLLIDFLNSDQKDFSVSGALASEENVKAHIHAQIQNKNKAQSKQELETITRNAQPAVKHQSQPLGKPQPTAPKKGGKALTMVSSSEETLVPDSMEKDYNSETLEQVANDQPPQQLDFTEISEAYKNRAERHELKIEILLISQKGKTFKSYSKNISLTGSLLEDNIPFDFYGVQFDLVVVNRNSLNPQNGRVQMRAETVGDGLTQRVRFISPSENLKQRLTNLLNDYLTKQTHIKKTS
ncbi:hypothetical protein CIK05_14480 [Bdellovibrio sp. qaytius]|nr:hypothetical protein CIK05_14480 [Bdellovibrio sp. qaytius]